MAREVFSVTHRPVICQEPRIPERTVTVTALTPGHAWLLGAVVAGASRGERTLQQAL